MICKISGPFWILILPKISFYIKPNQNRRSVDGIVLPDISTFANGHSNLPIITLKVSNLKEISSKGRFGSLNLMSSLY